MKYRFSKKLNAHISEIGMGTWGLDQEIWKGYDISAFARSFHMALEYGVNFIDTALSYGDGYAEKIIGDLINNLNVRNKVIIATKIPPLVNDHNSVKVTQAYPGDYIIECTMESLRNLNTDRIDIQQLHTWDPTWLGQGDWLQALQYLKSAGYIGAIGVSLKDHAPDTGETIVSSGVIDFVQVIYNLFDQTAARKLFELCQQNDVSVIARSPLYEGFLSGNVNALSQFPKGDWRRDFFAGGHLEECIERLDAIKAEIPIEGKSMADFALRFALSHPAVTTVITGMRSKKNVIENCNISDGRYLTNPVLNALEKHVWLTSLKLQ